jgi:hypothetical protein
MNIVFDYNVSTDGAPLAVSPIRDGSGRWLVQCRCCLRDFAQPTRVGALVTAEIHTYLGDAFECAAGEAAEIRRSRRLERATA